MSSYSIKFVYDNTSIVVAVEADNEDEAIEYAMKEADFEWGRGAYDYNDILVE